MPISKKSSIFYTERKIERFVEKLNDYRFIEKIDIKDFDYLIKKEDEVNPEIPTEGYDKANVGFRWGDLDEYLWTRFKFDFPDSWQGEKVYATFDLGFSEPGLSIGAETLMYVNGAPYKGVDSNHMEVLLKPEQVDKNTEFVLRTWSGVPNQHRYDFDENIFHGKRGPLGSMHTIRAYNVGILDEAVNSFYYDAFAAMQTIKVIKETNSTESNMLLKALERAYAVIDDTLELTDVKAYRQALHKSWEVYKEEKGAIVKNSNVHVRTVGQTHIDVAWLWRVKHTREKIARSFSTALRLMEEYPEFIFMQSQPQLFAYLKEDYPSIFSQIKDRVAEGRFEVDGAMWLESDCNIPSGESFSRQILYGKRFMKEEFGVESSYLWMPDVFGYSWALPQILKKCDVDTFMTTKMGWNQYNRIPFNSLYWKGIDGTKVMTHLIEDVGFMDMTADTMHNGWEKYKDKDIMDGFLYQFGLGDGGGGPTAKNIEMVKRFDEMPGLPHIEFTKAGDYFAELNEKADNHDGYVHTWDGEFYFELHRGTLTSQAFTKKFNRQLEFAYRDCEIHGVHSYLENGNWDVYDNEAITKGWKKILLNQFHDIIPGSSIKEVYDDALETYQESQAIVEQETQSILKTIVTEADSTYSIFNSSNFQVDGTVEIENDRDGAFYVEGEKVTSIYDGEKHVISLQNVKPMAYTALMFVADESHECENLFDVDGTTVKTPFYILEYNEFGHITSLLDLNNNRNVVREGEVINKLESYEDKPLDWDAWDIDIYYKEKSKTVTDLKSVEVVERNNLRLVIRFEYEHINSSITQDMILYAEDRRIDFKTRVDWQQSQRLLRSSFQVDVRSTKATFDIQYGNVERPTHWNTSWDWARFEMVGHKWVDLSDQFYGVSLMNDCKYGFDVFDNRIGITLLKAGIMPDPEADRGEHEFTYSLLPHAGTWRDAKVEQRSWALNNPFKAIKALAPAKTMFRFNNENIYVDAVKKCEEDDSVILRFHEFMGGTSEFELTSDYEIESFTEVNIMEREVVEKVKGNEIIGSIKPYEIKTYKLKFR